ncbi:MAG: hypothetical protein F9K17_02845 [Phycisphaerae bacterium]|nr:MAG: hypothetical protein F9K17_02845 [Phycisphaerae bacterium]
MASYTFTSGSVLQSGATQGALAGEAINAGEFVYLDPSDGKARKAECDATVDKAKVAGIAVNSAVAGQPISYVASGEVTVNAAFLSVGLLLVLSPTAGKCMDVGDLVNTQYVTVIGWSTAADKLKVNLAHSGIQRNPAP